MFAKINDHIKKYWWITPLLFLIVHFKNIQYPLFWNDEGETIMHTERVLEFGYPKVDDGKNVVYPINYHDKKIARHPRSDAYLGIGWVMFYAAAPAVWVADQFEGYYLKTGIIRVWLSLIGLLGIGIIFYVLAVEKWKQLLFIASGLMLLEISISLHLKDVRYMSPTLLLSSLQFLYWKKLKRKTFTYPIYIVLSSSTLWLIYNTFGPSYLSFAIGFIFFIYVHSGYSLKNTLRVAVVPILISFILLIPILIYFNAFSFSKAMSESYNQDVFWIFEQFKTIVKYFLKFGWGILFIFSLMYNWVQKDRFNLSLIAFVFTYALSLLLIPNAIYTRYFIFLIIIILIINANTFLNIIETQNKRWLTFLGVALFINLIIVFPHFKDRLYEITHRYKGPLDYTIPYIIDKYPNTKDLIIATNYEECSYMYYLDAKVIMGFVLNNEDKDLKETPDIIHYRKAWEWNYRKEEFLPFVKRGNYDSVRFNVYEYATNTIPELNTHPFPHPFKEKQSKDFNIELLIKKD